MDAKNADAAGGAATAGSDDAPAGRTAQGIKDGFEGSTARIVRGFGDADKPPSADADLPAFVALQAAAARDAWQLTRVVAAGAPVYLLRRLRFSEAFHELDELAAFLASRGVRR